MPPGSPTTRAALPSPPLTGVPPDVPQDVYNLANALDNVTLNTYGTLATRPVSTPASPGKLGRIYTTTDETPRQVYWDHGTGWIKIAQAPFDGAALADGTVGLAKLATDAKQHMRAIGDVWAWYRPDVAEPVPGGCVIPIGQTLTAAQHGFVSKAGQSVTLPDLRNVFILGANSANADASAGTPADGAANAPGIRGVGGSMVRSLGHSHTIATDGLHGHNLPNHTHNIDAEAPGTSYETAAHNHNLSLGKNVAAGAGSDYASKVTDSVTGTENQAHAHTVNAHAHGGYVSGFDGTHLGTNPAITDNQGAHSHGGGTGPGLGDINIRVPFVGLLYLMRVL